MNKLSQISLAIVAVIQTILHYLGIVGVLLSIVAFIFGNAGRGKELLLGGSSFIAFKYLIGFLFIPFINFFGNKSGEN